MRVGLFTGYLAMHRLNRQQGPGFVIWDTVLNRTELKHLAAKMWGAILGVFLFLYDGALPYARGGKMLGCKNGGWMLGFAHNNSQFAYTEALSMHNRSLQASSYALHETIDMSTLVDEDGHVLIPTEAQVRSICTRTSSA